MGVRLRTVAQALAGAPRSAAPERFVAVFRRLTEVLEEGSGSDGEISSLARSSILRTVVNGVNAADNLVITAPNKSQVRSEIDGETLQLIANLVKKPNAFILARQL